ncbi:MAG: hypothetical protein U9Q83_07050 [Bacteroidota bacterium]|nr:hypothetical protein [Bacteroidota bacterium]
MIKQLLLIAFFIITCVSTKAQGIFESSETDSNNVEFNGFVRSSAFGGTELYDYSSVFSEFCFQTKLSQDKTFLYSDLRFRTGLNFNEKYSVFQLKEAYAAYQSAKFDLFLGNQIITWGRTDGFNPTNNITPNDYFFLTDDLDDQKLSNFMLRTKLRFTQNIDIEIIATPFYKPSNYRYDLFNIGENISYTDIILPEKTFENISYATRLNFEYPKIGFSLSYFKGYSNFYGFDVQSIIFTTDNPEITNTPTPYLKNTIGADFSLPIKSLIFRGEIAYNIIEDYEESIYIPNPDIAYVAALEYNIWNATVIFQYIGKYSLDFTILQEPSLENPSDPYAQMQYAEDLIIYESEIFNRKIFYQQEETNHAISISINKNIAYNILNIELSGYYNVTSEELMIRPKINWKITDMLSATIGGAYMTGPEETVFNYSAPILSGIFIGLKASF